MDDPQARVIIERIHRAIARIEAASQHIPASTNGAEAGAAAAIQAKYDSLQRETGEVLAALDKIISGAQPGGQG